MGQICPLIEFTWKLFHHASNIRALVDTGLHTQLVDLWPCIRQCNRQLLMGVNGSISQLFGSESNATFHSQAGTTPCAAGITWRDPPTSPRPTLNSGTESISHTGHIVKSNIMKLKVSCCRYSIIACSMANRDRDDIHVWFLRR